MADGPIRDFLSTPSGGWAVVNNDFAAVGGAAAVPQGARIRVRTFLSEIFLDESQGVDYLGAILIKNPDHLRVRAELADALADTPDVTEVVGASLAGPDSRRRASINFKLATVYSQKPTSDSIEVP
jgi:hypothetical protein